MNGGTGRRRSLGRFFLAWTNHTGMPTLTLQSGGFQSSSGNGYRGPLQQDLAGSKLLFVGDQQSGIMSNNQNAGYSGYTIKAIAGAAAHAISTYNPNIVLLHAGTNDMNSPPLEEPLNTAPDRLGALIDQCIQGSPQAAILVAQIITSKKPENIPRIQNFNDAIPGLVKERAIAGHHIMVVDFSSITTNDLDDDLHPNDGGYKKMANIWLAAIERADGMGWIKPPIGPDPDYGSTPSCTKGEKSQCNSSPGWYNPRGDGIIASGVGHGGNAKFANDWGMCFPDCSLCAEFF